ncbi:TPA: TRAP transporter small permease [Mannheimia haemolytica]|uniref:TRAP transporter small permease protein n=1 Tax=Mannheimia haemolytica TaxID=75985 RepID=A0A248ZVU7_MANHA|nr:TRAP transporter small permease [Mannheimia haemolytica]AWW70304.1 TRAP transporter small permease [Pasteurellaceae bacterium 12565]AGI31313.1 TRAP transporter small permease [Mannheimia haemolytica USDA-ARS-USMARC-183]AGI34041.1 TRAP transporter small permease [Mannheimia haemolytica USDA-ARS-USMARC-185]AGK01043.1 C4-dicarboxylate transport DctQ [Mannheimia haemolytica M42548]AGQ25894.1 C4-dicarboxylate ABC transporter permease [Mannheimia haemolytica D153]
MKALAQLVGKLLEILVVVILSAMSILVFVNVVLRYGFNSSISVTEEVSRYMFVWLAFLGAVLAFSENQHVKVTMLTDKLSPTARNILSVVTDLAMLFCCYLIVDGSWIQFNLNLNNFAPISGLPQGITFLASTVAGVLIGLLIIARIVATVGVIAKGEK